MFIQDVIYKVLNMSESKSEKISSLVDNYRATTEDSSYVEQTIDDMINNEDLSSLWQNYHLIGDVIRDELPSSLQLDLSTQISEAIAAEPTVLSPQTSIKNTSVNNENKFKAKIIEFIKPFGQMAIAASAAGLMIVSVQQNYADNDDVVPSQVVQTRPLAGFANPVSFNYQEPSRQLQKEVILKQKIKQQHRFQALLADHQQQVKLNTSSPFEKRTIKNNIEKADVATSNATN